MKVFDQIEVVFQKLFTVKFIHEGYRGADVISRVISLKPDTDTNTLFQNHHILYRFSEDLLTCLIQCDEIDDPAAGVKERPRIMFEGSESPIRFLLNASTGFIKRTAIRVEGPQKVYYFSNKENAGNNMTISSDDEAVNPGDLRESADIKNEEPCLAVIDIHTNGIADAEYGLFDEEDFLVDNPPEYKITFTSLV